MDKHKRRTYKANKTAVLLNKKICDAFVSVLVAKAPYDFVLLSRSLSFFNLFESSRFIKGFQLTVPLI